MCSTMAQQQLPSALLCGVGHDTVGGGHDGSEPWSGDVVAFVLAGATVRDRHRTASRSGPLRIEGHAMS